MLFLHCVDRATKSLSYLQQAVSTDRLDFNLPPHSVRSNVNPTLAARAREIKSIESKSKTTRNSDVFDRGQRDLMKYLAWKNTVCLSHSHSLSLSSSTKRTGVCSATRSRCAVSVTECVRQRTMFALIRLQQL